MKANNDYEVFELLSDCINAVETLCESRKYSKTLIKFKIVNFKGLFINYIYNMPTETQTFTSLQKNNKN